MYTRQIGSVKRKRKGDGQSVKLKKKPAVRGVRFLGGTTTAHRYFKPGNMSASEKGFEVVGGEGTTDAKNHWGKTVLIGHETQTIPLGTGEKGEGG